MLALLELLGWIADIVGLDLKSLGPVARVVAVALYGLFGVLFFVVGFIPLFGSEWDGAKVLGGLAVSAIGFALLARIVYGLVEIRRLNRGQT